jgi:hypothetical protein
LVRVKKYHRSLHPAVSQYQSRNSPPAPEIEHPLGIPPQTAFDHLSEAVRVFDLDADGHASQKTELLGSKENCLELVHVVLRALIHDAIPLSRLRILLREDGPTGYPNPHD